MMKLNLMCILSLAVLGSVACQSGVVPYSQRQLGGIPKMGTDKTVGTHRGIKSDKKRHTDFYIKDEEVKIVPREERNTTGSLFKIDDSRNYFFASRAPVQVGDHVEILTNTNLLPPPPETGNNTNQQSEGNPNFSEIEQAIKDALPDLTPADDSQAKIVKRFKMKAEHQYPNGDVLVSYRRGSLGENFANEIHATARIPYEKLISGKPLQSTDLGDVHWRESKDGDFNERYSSSWEDEYTARLSGFDEAKSKVAMELDAKRTQLEEARGRLENQLEAMGNERSKIAQEREDLGKKQREQADTMKELEDTVQDQKDTIESQKAQIEALKPKENSPGDRREGTDGP